MLFDDILSYTAMKYLNKVLATLSERLLDSKNTAGMAFLLNIILNNK